MVRQSEEVADGEMVELCSAEVPDGTPTGACIVFIVDESLSMKNEHHWLIGFSRLLETELNKAGNNIMNKCLSKHDPSVNRHLHTNQNGMELIHNRIIFIKLC